MGKFSISCGNERHKAWRSMSPLMVNLKAKAGVFNVISKAFKRKDHRGIRHHFCNDCLKKCWNKRDITA